MKVTVTFSEHEISITKKNETEIIPPYFYSLNNKTILGHQVESGMDLYPMYISNIFLEEDEDRIKSFIKTLYDSVKKKWKASEISIQSDAANSVINDVICNIFPILPLKIIQKKKLKNSPSSILLKHFYNGLSSAITNEIILQYRISGSLFSRIYKIVFNKVPLYLQKLAKGEKLSVRCKLVHHTFSVLQIDIEIHDDMPMISQLIQNYKNSQLSETDRVKAQFEMFDSNYKVTFISPFSYGKSTLINGLIGEKILNMDIRAETAIITKVVAADSNKLFVKYNNNHIVMEDFFNHRDLREKLINVTSVRGNASPSEVQIYHSRNHLQGVTIIDAPGLNSRHADHNEIAEDALYVSDLILFLINPAHIGEANFAKQIKDFLAFIKENNKKYAFVLSKLDLHSDDYEKVMSEIKVVLTDIDPTYSTENVFFVSGYFALIGKLLQDNKIDITEVRKARDIFVLEDDEIVMGRAIEPHHSNTLLAFSQITKLEDFITERGEHHDYNEFHMDHRNTKTARVTANT